LFCEDLADFDEAASSVCLDRSERHACRSRDLFVRAAVVNRELQHLLLLRAKLRKRALREFLLLAEFGAIHAFRAIGDCFCDLRNLGPTHLAPTAVDQSPSRDHRNERCLTRDGTIKAGRALPKVDEDLLDGVFRIARRRAESACKTPDEPAESRNALRGRAWVTGSDAFENGRLI
jgi:hypothetical protein